MRLVKYRNYDRSRGALVAEACRQCNFTKRSRSYTHRNRAIYWQIFRNDARSDESHLHGLGRTDQWWGIAHRAAAEAAHEHRTQTCLYRCKSILYDSHYIKKILKQSFVRRQCLFGCLVCGHSRSIEVRH